MGVKLSRVPRELRYDLDRTVARHFPATNGAWVKAIDCERLIEEAIRKASERKNPSRIFGA